MPSPAPGQQPPTTSDETWQLLLRIKSNVQHVRDSKDAQKDILDRIVRTSREQKDVIAEMQSDLEKLRGGERPRGAHTSMSNSEISSPRASRKPELRRGRGAKVDQ